jgi:hypothetical protein
MSQESRADRDIDWDAYLDHVAALVGTTVPDEYRAEVIAYLKLTHTIARPHGGARRCGKSPRRR